MSLHEPLISVVTPCLNAAGVIRHVVESVAQTEFAKVEHIVVDGGSTDGTQEILEEYDHIVLISGSDDGPYDAVNIGFQRASGNVLAWLNADDFYVPRALDTVAEIFDAFSAVQWLTTSFPLFANEHGRTAGASWVPGYSHHHALHPDSTHFSLPVHAALQQESTFWRRELWEACGAQVDTRYRYAADFELWLRFWQQTVLYAANAPFGCFRWSAAQRSRTNEASYRKEVDQIIEQYGGGRAGIARTLGRRAALSLRGLPQAMLRYFPFSINQPTISYSRDHKQWELGTRFSLPV